MAYTVTQLATRPIVVVDLNDQIDAAQFEQAYRQSEKLLAAIQYPACLMLYFHEGALLLPEAVSTAAQVVARHQSFHGEARQMLQVLVQGQEEAAALLQALNALEIEVPVFEDTQAAMSFINLRLQGMQQPGSKPGTNQLKETLAVRPDFDLSEVQSRRQQPITSRRSVLPEGWMLRLEAPEMEKTMLCVPREELILGRRIEGQEDKDFINLNLWTGYSSGVSRRHAAIRLLENRELQLYDLNSVNGTFLNHTRLNPFEGYLLRDGDEIVLGRLVLLLSFLK